MKQCAGLGRPSDLSRNKRERATAGRVLGTIGLHLLAAMAQLPRFEDPLSLSTMGDKWGLGWLVVINDLRLESVK